jgi:hypothetical protein
MQIGFHSSGSALEEELCWPESIRDIAISPDLGRSIIWSHHGKLVKRSIPLMHFGAMVHCEICGLSSDDGKHI